MTKKIQAIRDEWIQKFADQIPGSFDFNEATKCWDAGFAKHAEMAKGLVEALEEMATKGNVMAHNALADYKKEMG